MAPRQIPIQTQTEHPDSTTVVIIGGGIVGLSAALTLAERNIPVVVLEKGRLGAEQSSRNLGWIRKTNRLADDIPLSFEADKLWATLSERTGIDVGYKQAGCLFAARSEKEMAMYESWYNATKHIDQLGSRLLSSKEIDERVPNGRGSWLGGVYTPSDGYAEAPIAPRAIAKLAMEKGAIIVENCAVRTLSLAGGKVAGVVTEQGEIRCEQVLLAAGLWSRKFLGNMGIKLPTLPLICSVLRTEAINGPSDIAFAAPDFSFRKHKDGGFVIMQRGAIEAQLTLDHALLGMKYLPTLKAQKDNMRIRFGKYFFNDLKLARRWKKDDITPFEIVRTMNPPVYEALNKEAMDNLSASWEVFKQAQIAEQWAGMIDVTPDSNPVIDRVKSVEGLTLATGFSGHGFGTGPAAGQLAADLVMNETPLVDPKIYTFDRF